MTVVDWLLDSDPAIRWQVMRDLTVEPAEVVAVERARVAREGWGARLLALQKVHDGVAHFEMEDGEGRPTRWNTLRAMRVLRWWNEGSSIEAAAVAAGEV